MIKRGIFCKRIMILMKQLAKYPWILREFLGGLGNYHYFVIETFFLRAKVIAKPFS